MVKVSSNYNNMITLSVIIPIYNEEDIFPKLIETLNNNLKGFPKSTEIILVNDGSSDNTPKMIDEICFKNENYIGIHLSRNFGHQQAINAGMNLANGQFVAIIDGDLQDPPELIPKMLLKLKGGYDVVYGVRKKRKENFVKRFFYNFFYYLFNFLSPLKIPLNSGDFCIMTRRVVDHIKQFKEKHRFNRGLRSYVGFKQISFEYERNARKAGIPKYTVSKLFLLALDGIFTFSEKPLKVATLFGFIVALLSFIYVIYLILWRFITNEDLPGFTTIATGIFFFSGIQLICIGILGEYIGRIHNEVKARPGYIVDKITVRK